VYLLALSTHLLCQPAPFRKQDCGAFALAETESALKAGAVQEPLDETGAASERSNLADECQILSGTAIRLSRLNLRIANGPGAASAGQTGRGRMGGEDAHTRPDRQAGCRSDRVI